MKKMQKVIAILGAVCLMIGSLSACGGAGGGNTPAEEGKAPATTLHETTSHAALPKDGEKYHIAFIVKSMQSAFFLNMLEGAEACAADYSDMFDITTFAPETPFNIDQQIQIVENCIANNYDAIVITPCDSTGIIPAIEKCNAAGIPVVTPNTKSNGGDILSYVGIDNYQVGYVVGEAMCEALNGSGNVLLMEGISGNSTSEDRKDGFTEAVKNYPNITLLDSQPADWDREKAMTVTENWLQTYNDIDAIFTMTKDMGLGSLQAIEAAGRTDEIMSVTFDIDDDVRAAMSAGTLYATCNQNERSQGYNALMAAVEYLRGYEVAAVQTIPATIIYATDLK